MGHKFTRRTFVKGAAVGAAATAGAGLAAAASGDAPASVSVREREPLDLALVNGKILTVDAKDTVASSVGIRDGRIAEVAKGPVGPAKRTIDLRGATVIPGLVDSHVHFLRAGINPGYEARLIETATSIAELQQLIAARAKTVPAGQFITCIGGWNRNGLRERRLPTPAELDAAAPNNPVYLSETGGGGQAVASTKAIAFFQGARVTVDASSGVLVPGQGQAALTAVQTEADKYRGTADMQAFASGLGLTMVHDMGGLAPGLGSYQYAYSLWQARALKVRLRFYWFSNEDSGMELMRARILNSFNRLGDDWWRPVGLGERINVNTTAPVFVDACKFAAENSWTLTQHSLTLAENQFHIQAYQAANAVRPIKPLRWSLAHLNAISDDLIQQMASTGISANVQGWQYTGAAGAAPLGPPFRKLLAAGIKLGGGTDATNVAAFNPWLMLYYMTTGRNNAGDLVNPGQTLTRLQALRLYTEGSSWLSWDDDRGAIEPGRSADLAVLSGDYLKVSDDGLRKLSSQLTLQAGTPVHATGPFAKLAKG